MATNARHPAAHRSGALLDHLARTSRQASETVLADHGLKTRHYVALTLLREQGASTQQGLARLLQVDPTNLVGLLNDLEAAGFVARTRSTVDRRRHVVELTEQGADQLGALEHALERVEDHVLGGLTAAQREQLFKLLRLATSGLALDCGAVAELDVAPE